MRKWGLVALLAVLAGPAALAVTSWQELKVPDVGLVVSLPGTPKLQSDMTEPDGTHGRIYTLEQGPIRYLVAVAVHPPGADRPKSPEAVLDRVRDMTVAHLGGKPRSERRFELDGSQAVSVVVDLPADADAGPSAAVLQIYVLGDEEIQVAALGSPAVDSDPDVTRFLASVHLGAK